MGISESNIIFLDTSYLVKLLRYAGKYSLSGLSFFEKTSQDKKILISTYVIEELSQDHVRSKIWIDDKLLFIKFLKKFLQKFGVFVYRSEDLDHKFLKYVKDKDDAMIIQDAVKSKSNWIITDNIKDFKVDLIYKDFGLKVKEKI